MAVILDEAGTGILDQAGTGIFDELGDSTTVTYGTARQATLTIPAATAGQSVLAHAGSGQMPLPRAQ